MSFTEAVREFLSEHEYRQSSPVTVRFYADRLEMFRRASGASAIGDLNPAAMKSWLLGLRRRGASSATLVNYDKAMRAFGSWLHRSGYLPAHPLAALPKPRSSASTLTTLTPGDVQGLLEAARASRQPLRNVALISLLLDTGMRAGEVSGLRLHDVGWAEGTLAIDGKTGARVIPFGSRAKRALRRYLTYERRAASSAVREVLLTPAGFRVPATGVTQVIRRLMHVAQVDTTKTGPHTFRHTFAVEFIRAGGDAFSLQRLLGHTTLDMTRRYVHLAASDLRAAHKRYSPGDRML